jgi:hypothetical protein
LNQQHRVAKAMKKGLVDDIAQENWLAGGIDRVAIALDDNLEGGYSFYHFEKVFDGCLAAKIDRTAEFIMKAAFGLDMSKRSVRCTRPFVLC